MVKELKFTEVTERLNPILEQGCRDGGFPFVAGHFYPHWRKMMELNVARTWENDGCLLGAIFSPDVFNGFQRGLVCFWFALPEARGTGRPAALFRAFESASASAGCKTVSAAFHSAATPVHVGQFFRRCYYDISETIFSKELN